MKCYKTIFITLVCAGLCLNTFAQTDSLRKGYTLKKTAKTPSPTERFFHPDSLLIAKVDSIYNSLSNEQRAAQMIMTASSTSPKLGFPFSKALEQVQKGYAGNVIFLKGEKETFTQQVNQLNNLPGIKPLYACDCEPSLMNGKWSGTQKVKKANEQNTEEEVEKNALVIVQDMKDVGVQLNFAPVADNSSNKEVISNRAFGREPNTIVKLSKKFIQTSQDQSIAASLKHFPGHGNVKGDSHKQLVFIDGELSELKTFKQIIQSEHPPMTVMVGHIAVRNNPKWNTNDLPSTISKKIVTQLLREELGYEGIIVTDAMNMLGVANFSNADWRAVVAGADIILMPSNPAKLNAKIAEELNKGGALAEQIEQSIKRILRLKIVLGIIP